MKNIIILFSLFYFQIVQAEPGPHITKMMQTPASAFDMFLFRLYEASKCNNVVKNNNFDEADLCMNSLKYDADKSILSAFFNIVPGAEAMDDFVDLEADGRKEILLKILQNTVRRVGAIDRWGLLHSIPISQGAKTDIADEKSFRTALARRTTTVLSTSYDGIVYIATRHHDGRIEYFTSK